MSEAAETIDELADRRHQQDASEVFMYTFAAVGALTVAEMDARHAAVPGAARGSSHSSPTPGPRPVTDSVFGAAISALTAPFGGEASTRSASAANDVGALTVGAGESAPLNTPDTVGPMFAAEVSGAALENPLASLTGHSAQLNNACALAVHEAPPARLGAGDVLQALGAYQTLSPEVASAFITVGLGETLRSPSLEVAVRA
jgi:hypothetical protein